MSENKKGKKRPPFSKEWKNKISLANIGKKHSEETKKKISESKKGKRPYIMTGEIKRKISEGRKGKPAWNKGLCIKHSGSFKSKDEHWNWRGGITPINKIIRKSLEYILWREAVFKRDNWTCVWCLTKGGELHPDHIKPFALFPELRFSIDNGRTLCASCHRKTDTYGWKTKNGIR